MLLGGTQILLALLLLQRKILEKNDENYMPIKIKKPKEE